jgi:hypothetical protein
VTEVRRGGARPGKAGRGEAGQGKARQGKARHGKAANGGIVRMCGKAGLGVAWLGEAGQGRVWLGKGANGTVRINGMAVFLGGLPYGPEIKRLREMFPVQKLTEGLIISHQTLEGVLNEKRGSGRYYGVINSWVARERNENGIFLRWEPYQGLKVLNPAELLDHAEAKTRQKIKQTARAIKMFGWVDRDRLDDLGKQRLDHQARNAIAIRDSLESAKKQLAIDLGPVQSLPKLLKKGG